MFRNVAFLEIKNFLSQIGFEIVTNMGIYEFVLLTSLIIHLFESASIMSVLRGAPPLEAEKRLKRREKGFKKMSVRRLSLAVFSFSSDNSR